MLRNMESAKNGVNRKKELDPHAEEIRQSSGIVCSSISFIRPRVQSSSHAPFHPPPVGATETNWFSSKQGRIENHAFATSRANCFAADERISVSM